MDKKEIFRKLLADNEFVFLDGAMGTMLQAKGMEAGGIPEMLNFDKPQWLKEIHGAYIEAGAQIVYTNTFGCNRYKMAKTGKTPGEIIPEAVRIAKEAADGRALAALDVGPIGQLLEPTGSLSFEEAYDIFREQMTAGEKAGADLIVCETMTDLYELKAAVLAAKENTDLPIICTMTFEQNGRTFTGCAVSSMALTLKGLGVDAIGVNCSLGPKELEPVVAELSKWTHLPIVVKPNAGLPDPVTGEYNVTPEGFAESLCGLVKYGVKIVGGCCGTTPEFIKAAVGALRKMKHVPNAPEIISAVCSPAKTVVIDGPRIIGERINPTGKKRFKEALKSGDTDYILGQAIEQAKAGADLLDVNVGLPDIDEKAVMVKTVKAIQGITELPLQLDSTIPEVLEAALRVYNGKPIVNSVNGEEKSLETILPLVKKYGAAVVGLTLDEGGIPKTAEGRFAIAEKIMNRALSMGIPKENIFIDCLTLTASAEQEGVMETVKALARVKNELGLKTVLGVSNISFGLPNRELINANFLQMCLSHGLDLPIINPNVPAMTGAVRAYRLLANIDKNAAEFIEAYNAAPTAAMAAPAATAASSANKESTPESLIAAVCGGLKGESGSITKELLKSHECMKIVDEMLIPALDKAGADFESGRIFLPQLILAAGAAQAAFEEIKKSMGGSKGVSKGKVVLATVKGDIHDIGKNIVKVLLENYGFEVIDLGRDVPYEDVLNAALDEEVKLVGLSALMTTTLKAMEETIALVKSNKPECRIVVGGAVLTPEYAMKIGADYYAKDAKATVDAAREVYETEVRS
ncbi:MAG: homocysteine S-methyltransferase family protein [Oscillospiraceae bacterium]|nr:homocysteine S-methyltransferase family protein [Oscillospiraceae bacterium]